MLYYHIIVIIIVIRLYVDVLDILYIRYCCKNMDENNLHESEQARLFFFMVQMMDTFSEKRYITTVNGGNENDIYI